MSKDSTNVNLKGKRKKKIPANANPLFTQWLTEWKLEAAEKGWKSAHTYTKALKTLKAFPLTLESGKDCKLLQNFGDKICKMLDEKLAEYKLNKGKLSADLSGHTNVNYKSNEGISSVPSQHQVASKKARNIADKFQDRIATHSVASSNSNCRDAPQMTNTESPLLAALSVVTNSAGLSGQTSYSAAAHSHDISDSSDLDSDLKVKSPPHKKKLQVTGNQRQSYVPAYRSGPYALILTLYRYMQDAEFKGYLTKSELSHAAQPYSDKSFTVPDAGSRYTAWSSMGTLIKKGFIVKTNSPARYTLTDEGYQLGQRLNAVDMENKGVFDIPSQRSAVSFNLTGLSTMHNLQRKSENTNNCEISDQLRFHSEEQHLTSDDEDGDLSKAITESLLSYSKEEAKKSQSSAPFLSTSIGGNIGHTVATKSGQTSQYNGCHDESSSSLSSITHDNDDAVLIVSDDDESDSNGLEHVIPTRTWAQYHSLSPSQSPPPQVKHSLKTSFLKPSISTEAISQSSFSSIKNISPDLQKYVTSSANASPRCIQHSPPILQQDKDIMEISDTSGDDDDTSHITSQDKGVAKINNESDDDELPDLILPLSKRLVQKGFPETGLLRNLTSTLVPQSSELQDSVTVTDKESSYQMSNFTNLKAKSVCSSDTITGKSASVLSASCSSHISNSSDYEQTSYRTVVANKQNFNRIETNGVFQKDTRTTNTVYKTGENYKLFQMGQALPAIYASSAETTETLQNHCPAFTFQPGTFDIILCLDNREFYGSKGSSKTLLPELMKSGIQCDLRLLHVGDLLWIARERVGHHTERGKELVLHYIIERKRMDDLVSSMTDGRLKEQKFRLKHCGLSDPIILIEEYGSIQNFSISEDRIKQSIVNSQVIDGFRVKRCASANDVVTYLATMTRFLSQYYSTKTLHATTLEHLKLLKGQQTIQKKEHYLIPFDVFNEASVKHKDLTVKEIFAKQLIQVPGVSADRARAIINVYPTFSSLMAAYNNCTDDKDRQRLLSGIKCGKKDRNLGIALSQMLCMLYTLKGSLS